MPKIVDHDAYRQELASKAIDVFSEHGYNGLGMRGIAEAIGISKSALYHYFPSKMLLFEACTELFSQPSNLYGKEQGAEIPETKEEALSALLTTMDGRFKGEMTLLLDYIKDRELEDIASDTLLRKADDSFLSELEKIVGSGKSEEAYALMMGGLLLRLFNGNQTNIEDIQSWIIELSKS